MLGIKSKLVILFLIFLNLGIYYNSIFYDFITLDDYNIILSLNNNPKELKDLFVLEGSHRYYRPILEFTFLIDQYIWRYSASGYHLTSIIINSINAILLYIIILLILGNNEKGRFISFVSSLIFSVHPIHTEAVCWVSSRTDLLSTLFLFGSFISYIHFSNNNNKKLIFLILSSILYLFSLLSKEAAISFPILVILYELFLKKDKKIKELILPIATFISITFFYLILRDLSLPEDIGFEKSSQIADSSYIASIKLLLASIGFYFKKLIYPFPLNFAIVDINIKLYVLIGTVILIFSIILLLKKGLNVFSIWWIIISLIPPTMIALTNIAWTPFAERYLYLPSAGFSILFGSILYYLLLKYHQKGKIIIFLFLFVPFTIFSISTYERSLIWMDNLSLWEDTVKKSPNFSRIYNEYGIALIKNNRWKEGEKAFKKAIELGFIIPPYVNLSKARIAQGDYKEGEEYLLYLIKLYPSNGELYRRLALYYIKSSDDYKERYIKAIDAFLKAYELEPGYTLALYKVGQLYLNLGEGEKAKLYLKKAIKEDPKAFYVKGAKRLIQNIERK